MQFMMMLTIISFSSVRDSAIIMVSATRVWSAIRLLAQFENLGELVKNTIFVA